LTAFRQVRHLFWNEVSTTSR